VATECKLKVEAPLVVRTGEQELTLKAPETLGDSVQAQFEDEAKIKVAEVLREGDTIKLRVDASEAPLGEWELTLRSGTTECKGDVRVATPDSSTR